MVNYHSNGVIKVNKNTYFKLYKNILKTCMDEGYPLPLLLEAIEVPEEYDYSIGEVRFIRSKDTSNKYHQRIIDRELKYSSIDDEMFIQEVGIALYINIQNRELLDFLSSYPQYESILK